MDNIPTSFKCQVVELTTDELKEMPHTVKFFTPSTNSLVLTPANLSGLIIQALTHATEPLRPPEIALLAGIPRPNNTAKSVNPTLYALEKEGRIRKITDAGGRNPRWQIVA